MKNKSPKDTRWAFFGTPDFTLHALHALAARGYVPALVITAPNKPRGRDRKPSPTPVGAWALERGIDVATPATLKNEAFLAELRNTDWDFFLVVAYAKMLPRAVLDVPRGSCLNLHPSLLPKYRGPSPYLSAILADDRHTGVTIMQMTEGMDAGPIVAQARVEIDEADPDDAAGAGWPLTGSMLATLLFTEGGNLLAEVLPQWLAGEITAEPQDELQATYTKKFTDEDALLRPSFEGQALTFDNPREAFLKIKAFDKGPRAHFFQNGRRIIVTDATMHDGTLKILRVIPEGKNEMDYATFCRANRAHTL